MNFLFDSGSDYRVSFIEFICTLIIETLIVSPLLNFLNLNSCSALHVALTMKGDGKSKGKAPASSTSGTTVPKSATPSSAESPPPEVVTVLSVSNMDVFSSVPPSNTKHPSDVVSGSGGGGDCPPSHSGGQCSGGAQLSDQVHHSLKRSFESEEMPGLYEHMMRFINAKKHAPAVTSSRLAPAALGAPPPDGSRCPSARRLLYSPTVIHTRCVREC